MAKKKAKKKSTKKDVPLDFGTAFSYPFNRAKGMWNVLWVFFPIFGWFALGGYGVRLVKEFVDGKFEQLPLFSFKSDMKLGFFMFLKAIPFIIVYVVVFEVLKAISNGVGGFAEFLFGIFVIPILGINFMKKETVKSLFEFKIVNVVFENFKDYIVMFLKSVGLAIVFLIMMIVLVGIPASLFTQNMFVADFYRRKVK